MRVVLYEILEVSLLLSYLVLWTEGFLLMLRYWLAFMVYFLLYLMVGLTFGWKWTQNLLFGFLMVIVLWFPGGFGLAGLNLLVYILSHIYKEGNVIADTLAKLHYDYVWIRGCPDFISSTLYSDMNEDYFLCFLILI